MTVSQHFPRLSHRSLVLITLVLGCSFIFSTQSYANTVISLGGSSCQVVNVPVALAAGQPSQYTIYGQLCLPKDDQGSQRYNTVQLLIHGGVYSHLYWDWPSIPGHPDWSYRYSAVRYLTNNGYSTFNIDRIGIGQSSHPDPSLVDIPTNAYVVHQLVGLLKTGGIGGVTFTHVILEGHSIGAATAVTEANTYHDVEGVIQTGFLHKVSSTGIGKLQFIQANQDPSGRFANLPSGYLTSAPGNLSAAFDPRTSDPAVIQYAEQVKETVTPGELNGTLNVPTNQITVPVLIIVGQEDLLFCEPDAVDCSSNASVYQEEAPYYSSQAQLQVAVIPRTNHVLTLTTTAHQTYDTIVNWLETYWN